MASSKRERELARMRAERQAARRAAADDHRHKQRLTILAAVSGIVVVAIVVGVVLLASNGSSKKKDTLSQPRPTSSAAAAVATPSTRPSAAATAATAGAAGSCSYPSSGTPAKKYVGHPATTGVNTTTPAKVVLTTNRGEIDLTLNSVKAPCTVNSFTFLTKAGYFNNTPCPRIVTSGIFVLQCGDPSGLGSGGPGYSFADENLTGAVYPKGTVAMANAGAGTNGSQFFLVYKDTQLGPNYTPFGTITKGLDLLNAIAAAGDDGSNSAGGGKPKQPVTIEKVTV